MKISQGEITTDQKLKTIEVAQRQSNRSSRCERGSHRECRGVKRLGHGQSVKCNCNCHKVKEVQ